MNGQGFNELTSKNGDVIWCNVVYVVNFGLTKKKNDEKNGVLTFTCFRENKSGVKHLKQGFDRQELECYSNNFDLNTSKAQEAAVWEWIKDSTISGTLGYGLWLSLPL